MERAVVGDVNNAMDCSRRRVLACIACASDHGNAIDTLYGNHVHNKLMEGPDPTQKNPLKKPQKNVNTCNGIIFTLSCYLASPLHTRVMHCYNEHTRTCYGTNEHINTCLPPA